MTIVLSDRVHGPLGATHESTRSDASDVDLTGMRGKRLMGRSD
jgi:hypothetical protein